MAVLAGTLQMCVCVCVCERERERKRDRERESKREYKAVSNCSQISDTCTNGSVLHIQPYKSYLYNVITYSNCDLLCENLAVSEIINFVVNVY